MSFDLAWSGFQLPMSSSEASIPISDWLSGFSSLLKGALVASLPVLVFRGLGFNVAPVNRAWRRHTRDCRARLQRVFRSFVDTSTLSSQLQATWRRVIRRLSWRPSPYRTYATRAAEDAYWQQAARAWHVLSFSDARFVKAPSQPQPQPQPLSRRSPRAEDRQVLYYVPRLLPEYREQRAAWRDPDARAHRIPAKSFVKWHRLVFPDRPHPSIIQAEEIMKRLSNQDLREIYRLARGVSDAREAKLFEAWFDEWCSEDDEEDQDAQFTQKFTRRWARWLDTKGPDVAIVFEEPEEDMVCAD